MITLLTVSDKTLNDLTKNQLKSVYWHEITPDDFDDINISTFNKIPENGLLSFCVDLNYDKFSKEFWDNAFTKKVLKTRYVSWEVLYSSKNKKQTYENHMDYFNKHICIEDLVHMGVVDISTCMDRVLNGFDAEAWELDIDKYTVLSSRNVSVESLLKEVEYRSEKLPVIGAFVDEIKYFNLQENVVVLLPNAILEEYNYPTMIDLTKELLKEYSVCSFGYETALTAMKLMGTDTLKWDDVCEYLRANSELFCDNDGIDECLTWWWETSFEIAETGEE